MLKTAIVHDWLVTYAGSERCVESFTNIWQDADLFTLVDFLDDEERKIILKEKEASTSFIQNLPFAKNKFRSYISLFPYAIEQFDLSRYDLIISSSHAVAKGVLTHQNQLHICYCHTPIRYAWDFYYQYLQNSGLDKGIKGIILKQILHKIRIWDVVSSNRVDYFIANSNYIAKRIKKIYNRESHVINPPVDIEKFSCCYEKENYFLAASRMVPYKKMDLIVEAFNKMPDKKLIVIGDGEDFEKIKSNASRNIEFLGYQKSEDLRKYMQKAKAFVFAAEEDFGITVVEAMSCGTPVIALNKGGTAETVEHEKTGILFNNQTPDDIKDAVNLFERKENLFDPGKLNESVKKYSRDQFEKNIKQFVESKLELFFKNKIKNQI